MCERVEINSEFSMSHVRRVATPDPWNQIQGSIRRRSSKDQGNGLDDAETENCTPLCLHSKGPIKKNGQIKFPENLLYFVLAISRSNFSQIQLS